MDAQALPCVLIDDCKDSEPATIRKPITHEVHTPSLIRPACSGQGYAHLPCSFGPLRRPHLQSLFSVQAIHAFRVYYPTFSAQHYGQPAVSISHSDTGQLSESKTKRHLRILLALVAVRPTCDSDQPTSTAFGQLVCLPHLRDQLPTCCGLQTFFDSTSCRICLSSVRSATNVFSCRFSSRNCRNSRNSLTPTPA